MNAELKAFVESYKRKTEPPIITIKEYMESNSDKAWKEYPKYSTFNDMRKRLKWTEEMDTILREKYPNHTAKDIAKTLKISADSVYNRAFFLGLKKDKEFVREVAKRNFQNNENAKKTMFKKGLIPYNKGKKQSEYMSADAIEKCKKTQFQKGHIPHNALEVGSEVIRVSKGLSYYMIKVPNQSKLVYKHTWLWEQANGAVPNGFNIVFKNGNSLDCRLENLECISDAELMERNTIHQYPPELASVIRLNGKLKNIINKKDKNG